MNDQTANKAALSVHSAGAPFVTVTEEVSVTISAWMDGDEQMTLPSELFTESGHATWQVYHLIGDTLRTPELAMTPQADLRQRVAQALAAEPSLSALAPAISQRNTLPAATPRVVSFSKLMRRVLLPSLAMAAAVASVVWVAKPLLIPELSSQSVQTARTTAPATSTLASSVEATAVHDYVTAHRQLSGPSNVRPASFGMTR